MPGSAITGIDNLYHVVLKGRGELSLKPGEVVSASVSSNDPANKSAVLVIKGMAVEVETELALKTGEAVQLKVEGASVEGEIRLRVVSGAGQTAVDPVKEFLTLALKGMGASRLTSSELGAIKNFFDSIPKAVLDKIPELAGLKSALATLEALAGTDLKAAVKGSGLFFESGLKGMSLFPGIEGDARLEMLSKFIKGDLKGALLVLEGALKRPEVAEVLLKSGVKVEELSRFVEKLVANVEFHQFQSKVSDTINIFMPLFWKNLKDGSVVFKGPEDDGRGGLKGSSCNINLELEDAGRLAVRVALDPRATTVSVTFVAESRDFLTRVDGNSDLLRQSLIDAGLRVANIATRHELKVDFEKAAQDEGLNIIA
jgi:hypothetical protein